MRINLAASGIILPDMVNMGNQTPVDEDETESEEEQDQYLSPNSSTEEERIGSCLTEVVITEASPLREESLDETGASRPQTIQRSSKKQKRKKQTKKDRSRKQAARSSAHLDSDDKMDSEMGDTNAVNNDAVESTMDVKMENKV
jgi:hypothetical protein